MAMFSPCIRNDEASGAQVIDGSLALYDDSSQYLTRAYDANTQRQKWTLSFWFKRGTLDIDANMFGTNSNTGLYFYWYGSANQLRILDYTGSSTNMYLLTTRTFRDTSGWSHCVFTIDTTNSTANDRNRLWIDGEEITQFDSRTNYSQNYLGIVNSNTTHTIGRLDAQWYYDGYISQVHLIEGVNLAPTTFAFTDPLTGMWRPKKVGAISGPNDGTVWSQYGSQSGGGTNAGYTIASLFTGKIGSHNVNYGYAAKNSNAWNDTVFTFTSAITASSTIRVYANSTGNSWGFNSTQANNGTNCTVTDLSSYTSASGWAIWEIDGVTSLSNISTSDAIQLFAIEVDGQILMDGDTTNYGYNGYYLPLDGNLPLYGDKSGRGNDWSSNNSPTFHYDSPTGVSYGADPNAGLTTTGFPTTYAKLDFDSYDMDDCANKGEGGLRSQVGNQGTADEHPIGNMSVSSGKWYFEWQFISTTDSGLWVGLVNPGSEIASGVRGTRWSLRFPGGEETFVLNGSQQTQSDTAADGAAGDWYGVAVDMDAGKWYVSCEGTWQLSADFDAGTGFVHNTLKSKGTGEVIPYWGTDGGSTTCEMRANFGQSTFKWLPPQGYKPWCTANMPVPTLARPDKQYFKPILYTGNGSQDPGLIVETPFKPDLVWIKRRATTTSHMLYDTVRGIGVNKALISNGTYEEGDTSGVTEASYGFLHTISPGSTSDKPPVTGEFNVRAGSSSGVYTNTNASTYVAWCWKAGGGSGAGDEFWIDGVEYASVGAAGLDGGGIDPTGASINTQCGFSIISYTGTGSNSDFAHGLGTNPAFMIIKGRDNTEDWCVYHVDIQTGNARWEEGNYYLLLNSKNHAAYATTTWANTFPTTSLVKIGTSGLVNTSGDKYIAYIWAEKPGLQKFGRYEGSGASNNFIYCGFRPSLIICKRYEANSSPDTSTSYTSWSMYDTTRNTYNNQTPNQLWANCGEAEGTRGNCSATSNLDDMMVEATSTGFYMHDEGSEVNALTGGYIYAAWAEVPQHGLYGGLANAR